jgi:hypothetical protein
MNRKPRSVVLAELADLLLKQSAAIRERDLERYVATYAPLERLCTQLRSAEGQATDPLERAWAATVRRLSRSIRAMLQTMQQPWSDLVREVVAESAGRAGPVGLDLRV